MRAKGLIGPGSAGSRVGSRLEHGEEGAREGAEVVGVDLAVEVVGEHGEDGHDDAHYGERVDDCGPGCQCGAGDSGEKRRRR